MKKFNTLFRGALVGCLICILSVGCITNDSGKKVIKPETAEALAATLTASVSGAVVYGYSKDKNTALYVDTIKTALQEFLLTDDLSAGALQAKLYALPIEKLKTPEAQLIIAPIIGAYKAFADERVKAGIRDNEGLQILVKAIVDGCEVGLQSIQQIESAGNTSKAEPATVDDGLKPVSGAIVAGIENHRAALTSR